MRVTEEKRNLLSKPHFQVPALFAILLGVTYFGYFITHLFAAGSAQLYLTPASGSATVGQSVTVQVMGNFGTEQINALEADFTYPANLQFVSIDAADSAFPLQAQSTGGSGTVKIARATNGGTSPVTGTAFIAKVQFTVVGPGTASLSFLNSSHIVRSTDNNDVLGTATGASFALAGVTAPPTSTPAPATPRPAATPTPVTGKTKTTPTPTPAPGHAVSPSPVAQASPTPTVTPVQSVASPVPVVASNLKPPVTTPVPVVKKLTPPQLTLAAAAAAVPILGLLIVGGLLLRRHKVPSFETFSNHHPSSAASPPGSSDPQQLVYPDSHPDHPDNKNKPQE